MIKIVNDGQRIVETNYFDHPNAMGGLFFVSWNAGACRLLVPDSMRADLHDMQTAKYVIISSGKWSGKGNALEILFEDDSDCPYVINLQIEQTDRSIPDTDQGGGLVFTAWDRHGERLQLPGKYRCVDRLPCLLPWVSH